MNWRIIVGILIVLSFGKETLNIIQDHRLGKVTFYPGGVIFSGILIAVGIYLFIKGMQLRNKKPPF